MSWEYMDLLQGLPFLISTLLWPARPSKSSMAGLVWFCCPVDVDEQHYVYA